MIRSLYYNALKPLLMSTLRLLMSAKEFESFRLVGGTSLSLQLGHRESVDIDLFTDSAYDSINFNAIDDYLRINFPYTDTFKTDIVGMGKSYYIGESADRSIKLDLFYTDTFIRPIVEIDGIRMASIEEIIAMKLEIMSNSGRKKDFWDLHELLSTYSIEEMLQLHEERYPYSHNRQEILTHLTQFEKADSDFDPICLKGKYWEVIKLDFLEYLKPYQIS